ncbi:restriction endonuclease [Limnohabitans sp. TS-CS-82]|jgi:type III restriction enzyme|uniref:BPTD_3080 family restriction endonuclease n=1 Tax=Limnohabitans sp. TS-CS-82 TaxID=2094193 RepID=UPI000CF1F516|nr:DEAD/DEAH box helicase family protein [Limnohabitans sp. TS-CS-82]PQA84529.1 restriction endonuclease [Limnohabitans sp. TS-CS-82]
MSNLFFEKPILNSPYDYPSQHWELDDTGQPTQKVINTRRTAEFVTPIPKPKKRKTKDKDAQVDLDLANEVSDELQQYHSAIINGVRAEVDKWRSLPNPSDWGVTPETARLLQHWRHHNFSGVRPFFCQVEAVETAIWLTEVAPKRGKMAQTFLDHLQSANEDANPGLMRLALKLATGAGKTTVMAMIIAWQTINAARRPTSTKYTRGFLLVAPGLTIKDRLRVLLPNDPESYYKTRELVPSDMMADLERCKIVITNYHSFKLRERLELAKGTRLLLQGREGSSLDTLESEGQMIQRVMPELMGMKNIMVINDEAHHCYQEKPVKQDDSEDLKGDDKKEAEENNEAARLWINGIKSVQRQLGLNRVIDLSATPFFLRGSGYVEGTLFPWTMSDFSLMDAIECGIVKLPRVPVSDNIVGAEVPVFRNLWENISKDMPKKGRGKGEVLDPLKLPTKLQTALQALYGHYEKTFEFWKSEGIRVPPCFIVVCNNTSTSKLVYDYISGFQPASSPDETTPPPNLGALKLFSNYDEYGNPLARPRTLLIDSEQLESGEALDDNFRKMADAEIQQFRREIIERTGDLQAGNNITESDLLREAMNTVGKVGRLGETIRCVVSVSMLTEGWDTNTVTHVLGVRAFGTQLLCEQVIGRALRRQSYELNAEGKFDVEYADVLGIPFDFNAEPTIAKPVKPRETVHVKAIKPERDVHEIRFPRVQGYRVVLPEETVDAVFNEDSTLVLTPALVGPSITKQEGIIGEGVELTLAHTKDMRKSTLLYHLTQRLLYTKFRDPGEEPKLHLFGQLKRVVKQWLDQHLKCMGDTYPAQLLYLELADRACERIKQAIDRANLEKGDSQIQAVLDPYNPVGSTAHVNFTTTKTDRWEASAKHCHLNWLIMDSDWEAEFCRAAEAHPKVVSYVKNHNLGFEVPYLIGAETHRYLPDFILRVDDGHGPDDLLYLVVEIKGYRGENAKDKKAAMETRWLPGVNNTKHHGRWAFAEFTDVYAMQKDLADKVQSQFNAMLNKVTPGVPL